MRALAVLALLLGWPVVAQEHQYTRFLVPFVDNLPQPGAFGSRWEARTWLYNAGDQNVALTPTPACGGVCGPVAIIPPALPIPTTLFGQYAGDSPAVLVHVDGRYGDALRFESRVRDAARASDSAGTEVPVVREDRFSGGVLELLNVPRQGPFRLMLRVYALPECTNPIVTVRYYDMGTQLLFSEQLALRSYPLITTVPGVVAYAPSSITRGDIEHVAALAATDVMRIEILPASAGLRFWAFASVTNNDTQQVTLVTP